MENTRRSTPVNDPFGAFTDRILEAERCVLAVGWRDPKALFEESCRAELTSDHFTLPDHTVQFAYLCDCGFRKRRPDFDELLRIAVTAAQVYLTIYDLDPCLWVDYRHELLPTYIETVIDNAADRDRLRQHLAQAGEILRAQVGPGFALAAIPTGVYRKEAAKNEYAGRERNRPVRSGPHHRQHGRRFRRTG